MAIKAIKKILWMLAILVGLFAILCGALCIYGLDSLHAAILLSVIEENPTMTSATAYSEATILTYATIVIALVWGVVLVGIGLIGIADKGKLKHDRIRVVLFIIAVALIMRGTELLVTLPLPSTHGRLVHLITALACIVGGASGILPLKWNRKFPVILVSTGLMVAMEIAAISPNISSPTALTSSVTLPLLTVAFYVMFFIISFKCMQLSCAFEPTIPERIKTGEAIKRPLAFYEQVETILMARTDIMELFHAIKDRLPNDVEVAMLTDTEHSIYLNAEYWSAIIEKQKLSPTSDVCAIRFPDYKVDFQVENEYRAIEEMNIALTAIEASILTFDSQALCQVRHANTNERAANVSSFDNESVDSLSFFTVSAASRAAANMAVSLGENAAESASSAHKDSVETEKANQTEPLVLRYLGTSALPDSTSCDAEALAGQEATTSWYVAEATKDEPDYSMTSNRKRQLSRSVAGLIAVAIISTLAMFIVNQSIPSTIIP